MIKIIIVVCVITIATCRGESIKQENARLKSENKILKAENAILKTKIIKLSQSKTNIKEKRIKGLKVERSEIEKKIEYNKKQLAKYPFVKRSNRDKVKKYKNALRYYNGRYTKVNNEIAKLSKK
jgi:septal ring factor EnvC (AmiA/AmiB activator)